MSTARFSLPLAAALVLSSLAGTSSAQVTLESDQPAYEISQLLTIKISGPPGAPTFLLVDVIPGPIVFPFGTIEVGFSPLFFVVNLGAMPASGSMTLHEAFSCRTVQTYGTEVYMQAICVVNGVKVLSNGLHFAEMGGDCNDDCIGGVAEIGFQVPLEGVPETGVLHISALKQNGFPHEYGPFDVPLDLFTDATGILAVPLESPNGGIIVSMLEWDGSTLLVRFFVDAPAAGHVKLGGNTKFTISFGGVEKSVVIHTSCSQPLFVGQVYGDFTVIKLIDIG